MVISSTLEEVSLLEVCDFYSGKAHEHFVTTNGKYKIINSKFVATDGDVFKESNLSFLTAKKNDITMVMSDLPNGRALAKCFLVDQDDKYAVNQRVCILRSKGYDPKYLYYVLNRNPYFLAFNDGVSQTHLLNHVFEKCKLMITKDIAEQKAIAEALSDIDNLISISKIEKRKLEKLLAGKLAHLFSPQFQTKYHFEDTTIDELSFVTKGSARRYSDTYSPSTYPFVNGGINPSGYTDSFNCEPGTVLVSEGGNSCGYVNFYRERVWSAGHSYRLKAKNELVRAEYLYYLLKFNESRIMGLRVGSGLPNVQAKDLKALSLKHCKDSTYQEIVIQELDDITSLIENSSKMLQEYEWLKQGMMHDLLTGRVRLV